MSIASFLKSLFSFPSNSFESVVLLKGVASQICELARAHYPREVVYFLSGKILNHTLFIDGLLYQHYSSDSRHGIVYQNLPILSSMVGSFHSHPGFFVTLQKQTFLFLGSTALSILLLKNRMILILFVLMTVMGTQYHFNSHDLLVSFFFQNKKTHNPLNFLLRFGGGSCF